MDIQTIALPLKRFILTDHERCPPEWRHLDLYLFRDEEVVFYVGQSQLAYKRVWNHLLGGFHGHSMIGRFMWANWPASMKFTIELMSSQSEEFAAIRHDLSAAERALIERWCPCFNVSLNSRPAPMPVRYRPANARLQCGGLNKLIHQAERVVKVDDAKLLIQESP